MTAHKPTAPKRGGGRVCRSAEKTTFDNSPDTTPRPADQAPRVGELIDKHGHRHGEIILSMWSRAALRALGVHRVEPEEREP